ncbi:MAG: carbohydrate-binding family 9-like protein [Spirochaetota bacterium]
MSTYIINRVPRIHSRDSNTGSGSRESSGYGWTSWNSPPWKHAEELEVSFFHPGSKSTHPNTRCKVLYDKSFLYWSFRVEDRWVRARFLEYQDPVCRDSCVEFFVQPAQEAGYFNFELNCIGTMQLFYIEDPTRTKTGFMKATPISATDAAGIQIRASIQERPYLPENHEPMEWWMDAAVPFSLFSKHVPEFTPPVPGTEWRGNFYKCADDSSHPHWAAWAPIGDELNFHVPQYFGTLRFA